MGECKIDYCNCENVKGVYTGGDDGFGYWDMCDTCNKRLEDGHHYYNLNDGEDNETDLY